MLYNTLGKTNLKVSRLGFGTMRLPTKADNSDIDEAKASEMLKYGIENGVNIIDTAYPYHSAELDGNGNSEVFLGNFLKENSLRDEIILQTKSPSWLIEKYSDFDFYLEKCRALFFILPKDEFLQFYGYLTEKDYDAMPFLKGDRFEETPCGIYELRLGERRSKITNATVRIDSIREVYVDDENKNRGADDNLLNFVGFIYAESLAKALLKR